MNIEFVWTWKIPNLQVLFQKTSKTLIASDTWLIVSSDLYCYSTLRAVNDPYASFHEAWRENDFLGRYLVSLRCSYHRFVDIYTSLCLSLSFFFSFSLSLPFFPPRPLSFSVSLSLCACLFVLCRLLNAALSSSLPSPPRCIVSPPSSSLLSLSPPYTTRVHIRSICAGNFQTDCWGHWPTGKWCEPLIRLSITATTWLHKSVTRNLNGAGSSRKDLLSYQGGSPKWANSHKILFWMRWVRRSGAQNGSINGPARSTRGAWRLCSLWHARMMIRSAVKFIPMMRRPVSTLWWSKARRSKKWPKTSMPHSSGKCPRFRRRCARDRYLRIIICPDSLSISQCLLTANSSNFECLFKFLLTTIVKCWQPSLSSLMHSTLNHTLSSH